MKRLTVNLVGSVSRWAGRSFVIELDDDVEVATLDQQVLETLADDARIPWEFGEERVLAVTDHFIGEEVDARLPVIQFNQSNESADVAR